ncbi:hypothetical protein Val02_16230 [Virgisporangium aliadipatigenens]|uniref:N-acetyltransferase n=1 Tax=Virgisporangium aliadipatigenens TaxID=741659 RepID=A0A8J3YI50_9ACTN|nr:N-acetyltransferase [Virgisporangium aliadipatigenens]GIJ44737.1 hypothetical protein Val02_16230 [Virgisporangium aliadipatigenens]
MEVTTISLADRPDLADRVFAIPYAEADGRFMAGNLAAALMRRTRLAARWPQYVVAVLDGDGTPVARGVSVPFAATAPGRTRYPSGGWDQVAVWAAEDALDGRVGETLCALEVAVHPEVRGRNLAGRTLIALRDNASRLGFGDLIVPVRPPAKALEPEVPIAEYVARLRADGLPADPWLRVHVRLGGEVVGIASHSGTVCAPLADWRAWTGLPFDVEGPVCVGGGLVPVFVSTALDLGIYVEPNIWVRHRF